VILHPHRLLPVHLVAVLDGIDQGLTEQQRQPRSPEQPQAQSGSTGAADEETAAFEAVSENYAQCGLILARVSALLRGASERSYSSTDNKRIFSALPCGGTDYMDQRGLHVRLEAYRFKFV